VRDCVDKKERPKFVLVDRSSVASQARASAGTTIVSLQQLLLKEEFFNNSKLKGRAEEKTFELRYSHLKICRADKPWDRRTCISVWELDRLFQLKIVGAERINENSKNFLYSPPPPKTKFLEFPFWLMSSFRAASNNTALHNASVQMFVSCGIYFGSTPLIPLRYTKGVNPSANPRWGQSLKFDLAICHIPRVCSNILVFY